MQQRGHRHLYQRGSRGGYHRHSYRRGLDESYFSKTKPFVAVDPNKFAGTSWINESYERRVVDILFATVRKLENGDAPAAPTYSGERSEILNFGQARVRIPEDHKIGRLELPGGLSVFGIQLTHEEADPKKHFILRSRQPLTLEQWDSEIETIGPNDAVVFVHGFNTSFDDSVFRFAQIVWDLQYKGLPVLFSWASRGAVADYLYDQNSVLFARDAFMKLLANLVEKHKIAIAGRATFAVLPGSASRIFPSGQESPQAKPPSPTSANSMVGSLKLRPLTLLREFHGFNQR